MLSNVSVALSNLYIFFAEGFYLCFDWCFVLLSSICSCVLRCMRSLHILETNFLLVFQLLFSSVQFSRSACPTLCDAMNCSTPGLPVHRQLPEFTQSCYYFGPILKLHIHLNYSFLHCTKTIEFN